MKRSLLKELSKSNRGTIILTNILHSIQEKLISEEDTTWFLEACSAHYDPGEYDTPNKIIGLLNKVSTGEKTTINKEQFLFCCPKSTSLINKKTLFVNVLKFEVFCENIINSGTSLGSRYHVSNWANKAIPHSPEGALELGHLINDFSRGKIKLKDKFENKWIGRKKGGVFWISLNSVLQQEIDSVNSVKRSDRVRDVLGLIDYNNRKKKETVLVALLIPGDLISKKRHARPTFADAIKHSRFKPHADLPQNRKRSGWGCTVDLEKIFFKKKDVDGLPERIVEAIPTWEVEELEYFILGKLKSARGLDDSDCNRAFKERLLNGKDINAVIDELMSL